MAAPTFTALNGQIKTPWRWYDGQHKLTQYQPQCREELEGCIRNAVLSANSSLPPFQFPRPSSVLGITSWKLYDADGNELVDLAADIAQLEVIPFYGYDYVVYDGSPLSASLEPGVYYGRIVSNGVTYYSEPVQVACDIDQANCFPDPAFPGDNFQNDLEPAQMWSIHSSWTRIAANTVNTPGDPAVPASPVNGQQVINLADNLLYTRTAGVWVSSTPAASTNWFDLSNGAWYDFDGAAWISTNASMAGMFENYGVCFNGIGNASVPVGTQVGSLDCSCLDGDPLRIDVTIAEVVAGSVVIKIMDGVTEIATSGTLTANGTFSFSSVIANGYELVIIPSADFEGCVTNIGFFCPGSASNCFRRLTWTNCGNVGTTYYAGGFVQELWLRSEVVPMKPTPTNRIESEEQADGSLVETFRRKEVRYELRLGLVPWHVADALSDLPMMDTVRLYHLAGDGYDTLTDVKVENIWDEDTSECLPEIRITFLLDAAAVACCDEFDKPCVSACAEAGDFVSNIDHGGTPAGNYISDDAPSYEFWDGGVYSATLPCNSGCIDLVANVEEGDPESRITYLWNIALETWQLLAAFVTSDGISPCGYLLTAAVTEGYRAVLQYATDDTWIDFEDMDFTADEWATNTVVFDLPSVKYSVRLKVYLPLSNGTQCVIGYSANLRRTCD